MSKKLVITGLCLLMSVVLLATASFAWFTISSNPEISGMQVRLFTDEALLVSADGETFSQYIDLSEEFKYYAPLKPISTANGKDWFIATYNDDGTLAELSEFTHDNTNRYGNVWVYDQASKTDTGKTDANGNPIYTYTQLTGDAYTQANERGYYVYCTFWLKTELDEGCRVTLSAPTQGNSNIEQWEKDQNIYGSYVLGNYELRQDEQGQDNVAYLDNNAQNAMRVGFMTGAVGSERFVIYEPNADKRSSLDKPDPSKDGNGNYVYGFELQTEVPTEPPTPSGDGTPTETETPEVAGPIYSNYKDNMYIPTKPIGLVGTTISTVNIPNDNLIIQKSSSWNEAALRQALIDKRAPGANEVAEFGRFIKYNTDFNTSDGTPTTFNDSDMTDLASSTIIVDLEKDVAQQVTMFIWIEGQDADCWNDIASGSFVVNLEFAAQDKPKENIQN